MAQIMDVTCPECKGRKTREYAQWPTHLNTYNEEMKPEDLSVTTRTEPCHTCKGLGWVKPTKPIQLIQHGRVVGTVPPNFDPQRIKSTSFWYTPRPGDFTREGDTWVASRTLGPGDLEAIPGFVWDRSRYTK